MDKFMANNWFSKKIILLKKKKIYPSANVLSNKFFRKTMAINMISFWKCWKAISHIIGATLQGNCHNLTAKLLNISLFVKHMIENSFFYEQLGWKRLQSNLQQLVFSDLFADSITHLATGLKLGRYVYTAYRNWDNYELDNEIATGNEKNDEETEDIERPPDYLYTLYSMYNW